MSDPTTINCAASCIVTVQPYHATPDDYTAVTQIWAAIFVASCVIWGLKRLYVLFTGDRPES